MRNIKGAVGLVVGLSLLTSCGTSGPASVPSAAPAASQDASVILTVALPAYLSPNVSNELISQFESSHPGDKVSVVKVDPNIPPAAAGLDTHLAAVQQYSSAADVLYVASTPYLNTNSAISTEATRAGYFLNLKPLIDSDTELNSADYYPAIWQSYQWDQGVWALPFGAKVCADL